MHRKGQVMFKLIKYEFRKNVNTLFIMAGLLAGAQIYFMYAYYIAQNRYKAMSGASALMFCAVLSFFMVFFSGVMTYSKELSSKTSYLVFMTPNTAIKIIGSKLLFTFFSGTAAALVLGGVGLVDFKMLMKMWDEELSIVEMIVEILHNFGFNMVEIAYNIFSSILNFLIVFFMVMTMAYFCITLTATVLQNKKIKGVISTVLFLLVLWGVTKLGDLLPELYETPHNMVQASLAHLPQTLLFLAVMAGCIVGTAQLLEHKVSL